MSFGLAWPGARPVRRFMALAVWGGLVLGLLLIGLDVRSRRGTDYLGARNEALHQGTPRFFERTSAGVLASGGVIAFDWDHTFGPLWPNAPEQIQTLSWRESLVWQRTSYAFNVPDGGGSQLRFWLASIGFAWTAWENVGDLVVTANTSHIVIAVPLWFCWLLALMPAILWLCRWSRRRSPTGRFEVIADGPAGPDARPTASRRPG